MKLSHTDRNRDTISLSLSRISGGLMQLTRRADGEGQALSLIDTIARQSVVSGTVKKLRRGGDGVTTLASLNPPTGFTNRLPAQFQIATPLVAAVVDEVLASAL
jgi:hypothetical protein